MTTSGYPNGPNSVGDIAIEPTTAPPPWWATSGSEGPTQGPAVARGPAPVDRLSPAPRAMTASVAARPQGSLFDCQLESRPEGRQASLADSLRRPAPTRRIEEDDTPIYCEVLRDLGMPGLDPVGPTEIVEVFVVDPPEDQEAEDDTVVETELIDQSSELVDASSETSLILLSSGRGNSTPPHRGGTGAPGRAAIGWNRPTGRSRLIVPSRSIREVG